MRKSYSLALFAGVLALGACGKKPQEEPVENNVIVEEPEDVPVENFTDAPPPPVTNIVKPVENRVAPPEISEEQQMQDDAEATGMTSRLPDEESSSPSMGGSAR